MRNAKNTAIDRIYVDIQKRDVYDVGRGNTPLNNAPYPPSNENVSTAERGTVLLLRAAKSTKRSKKT